MFKKMIKPVQKNDNALMAIGMYFMNAKLLYSSSNDFPYIRRKKEKRHIVTLNREQKKCMINPTTFNEKIFSARKDFFPVQYYKKNK